MTAWQISMCDRLRTLEGDHRALLVAFGAAFMVVMGAITGTYLSLSAKQDAGFERMIGRIDALGGEVADVKADVAVLKERSGSPGQDASRPSRNSTS